MKKPLFLLALLLLPFQAPGQTDPKLVAYLESLNKYYYCLSRAGLKGFQCQAAGQFSGQPPAGIAADWQGLNWQNSHCTFDFSYTNGETQPILSFSSNGGDPAATPASFRRLMNLVNQMLLVWGSFVTEPVYDRSDKSSVYTMAKGPDCPLRITEKSPGALVDVDFDAKSLAKRFIVHTKKETTEMDLTFINMPQGVILRQVEMPFHSKKELYMVDLVLHYQQVQGFLLPDSLTLFFRSAGKIFQATFQMSDYQVRRKDEVSPISEQADAQVIPASAEPVGAKHFLWRIRSSTATVYLLGSIHLRPKVPLQLPEVIDQSFATANYVGFECDISKLDQFDKERIPYESQHCVYTPPDNLKNHLSALEWKKVRLLLKYFHVDEQVAIHYKPYALPDLFQAPSSGQAVIQKKNGIDMIFLRKAQAANKVVFGLEYWWEPLKHLDTLTDHEQAVCLLGGAPMPHSHPRLLEELLADWKTGNTEDMDSLINIDLGAEDKVYMDKIVKERNTVWMGQLDKIFRTQGTYFIVVGSGHLVGQNGLPNLLRAAGYPVEQL